MQHKRGNDIINQYNYSYNTAQMIKSITRKQQAGTSGAKMTFAYDKIYQLTSETGNYITDFSVPSAASVANKFSYDNAGNRIFSSSIDSHPRSYQHTPDNQLTKINWNAGTVTLDGEIQQAWTANYVRVRQTTPTVSDWVYAKFRCNRKKPVIWEAKNVLAFGTGLLDYEIEVQTPDNQILTKKISYNRISENTKNIIYEYDNRGNRTKKTEINGTMSTSVNYQYDLENQLTGINGYDKDGNHFVYSYKYDPFGRRIKATEDGVSRYFVRNSPE